MDSTSEQRAERSDRGDSGSAAKTSHAVDTRLPEVELGVDLLDVTEHVLPVQVHGAVLAELAAPADQRGGQEDGAGDVRLQNRRRCRQQGQGHLPKIPASGVQAERSRYLLSWVGNGL